MAGDGLRVFHGEFLVLPAPLELSGNWCSHGCSFCFANAANPTRQLDLKGVMALLANHQNRGGLESKLLTLKYPVNISNHIDPFSESNHKHMVPIMSLMTDLDIPIYFQTRGGNEGAIAATLDFIKPSVFYVSITHQTDESRQIIEPNAPTIEHRYALIEELVSKGHRVLVGLNPLTPEWMPDTESILLRLHELGVDGVWIETLHLNRYQLAGMKPWQKKRLGDDMVKKAMKLNTCDEHHEHFLHTRQLAEEIGLEVMTAGQPNPSRFFDCFHETYDQTFPVVQDIINFCHDNEVQLVDWDLWRSFFSPRLPSVGETAQHMDYLRQAVHRELSSIPYLVNRAKNRFNYLRVLKYSYWDERLRKLPFSPWGHPAFAQVTRQGKPIYRTESGELTPDKKQGMPLFLYNPSGDVVNAEMG